jgi:hypothetical protein
MMVACYQRQHPGGYLPLASKYSLRNILDRRPGVARKLARPFGSNDVRHSRYREILIETSIVTKATARPALPALPPSLSRRDHQPSRLAVSRVQPQLTGRRVAAG